MPKKILPVIQNHISRKEFRFEKENVALNFTLRTDIKKELQIFVELIDLARVELIKEIKKQD